jgi:hypothetical protein
LTEASKGLSLSAPFQSVLYSSFFLPLSLCAESPLTCGQGIFCFCPLAYGPSERSLEINTHLEKIFLKILNFPLDNQIPLCYNTDTKRKRVIEMEKEKTTIEELKEMPRNDGWETTPTIGENENWTGEVEKW